MCNPNKTTNIMRARLLLTLMASAAIILICLTAPPVLASGLDPGAQPLQAAPGPPNDRDDVLWVSSIPTGVDVYVGPADEWRSLFTVQNKRGKSPIAVRVPPGNWLVGVVQPASRLDRATRFAFPGPGLAPGDFFVVSDGQLRIDHDGEATSLGETLVRVGRGVPFQLPYCPDGESWTYFQFVGREPQRVGKVYAITKEAGKSATLISLFRPARVTASDVDRLYPPLPSYPIGDAMAVQERLIRELSLGASEASAMLGLVRRGGKAVWVGKAQRGTIRLVVVEWHPGGIRVSEADAPLKFLQTVASGLGS